MRSLFLALTFLGTAGMLSASPSQEPTGPETEVRSTTVLVDVVVRDRQGDPLRGLQASDFELYEDGVLQDIDYFESHIQGGEDAPTSTGQSAPAGAAEEDVSSSQGRFTALVFDRLSPNARDFARKAGLAYLSDAALPGDRIGVFFADLSPRVLQPYTVDQGRVEDAINRALGGTSSRQGGGSAEATTGSSGATNAADPGDLSLGGLNSGDVVDSSAPTVDSGLEGMSGRMTSMARSISADRQGYATTNSLLAIVKSLEKIPGRKTIVYFSEGISIPPAIEARFRSVIDNANRANVSIYAVDAAGLRIESTGSLGGNQIVSASSRGGTYMASHSESVNGDSLLRDVLERNETALRADAHGSMNRLADETGGLLLRETNDIAEGMQEIGQDMRNYYILGYQPKNGELDGSFRKIEVTVKKKDARVRYRKGYFAVDQTIDQPVQPFERLVLARLAQHREGNGGSLPVKLSVLSFPKPEDPGFTTLLAEVPPGTLTYRAASDGRSLSDFALVALVRNSDGNVIGKVSQHYQLPGAEDGSKPTNGILFYRVLHLPVGSFQIELAGYDAHSNEAGFDRAGLVVSEPDPTLPHLSSILLVGRAEPVAAEGPGADTPFYYQDILLYPNMTGRISKESSDEMTFFFTVYPANADSQEAIIDVRRFNQPIERMQVKLPKEDEKGRIQFAGTLPVKDYQTGTYTLTVAVPAGEQVVTRTCRFLLMP